MRAGRGQEIKQPRSQALSPFPRTSSRIGDQHGPTERHDVSRFPANQSPQISLFLKE